MASPNLTSERGRNGETYEQGSDVPFAVSSRCPTVGKRWWHRLSVVVFFKLLLGTLVTVAAIFYLAWAPKVRHYPVVFENFYLFDVSADALPKIEGPEGHVVQMPNGTWATFPFGTSDKEIHARWDRAKRHQILSAMLWAALVSVFATLAVNYVLQAVYRLLLYAAFDRKHAHAPSRSRKAVPAG